MSDATTEQGEAAPGAGSGRRTLVRRRDLLVAAAMLLSTLATWYPYRDRMDIVARYWDGPLYIYAAQTLYRIPEPNAFVEYRLPARYFACHLPLYPLLIRAVSLLGLGWMGGWAGAMLLATALSAMVAAVLFLRLLEAWDLVQSPVDTALLFCVFPPRWILYHSVGATEPLFLCCLFAAFLAYRRERPALVSLATALACLTRINGLLVLATFGLLYLARRRYRALAVVALAGAAPLALGLMHRVLFGDALAYFRWNIGQAGLLAEGLFSTYRAYSYTDDFQATEYYYFTYMVHAAGTLALWRWRPLFVYAVLTFVLSATIYHVDVGRYLLALSPLALLVGLDPVLGGRRARLLLPLAAFLGYQYAWGYLPHNGVVKPTWERVLRAPPRSLPDGPGLGPANR